jgi:sulfoxide reductase heme-binding subunit YedZ
VKLGFFLAVLAPTFWMALEWQMGWLSPKPVTDILRESGDWAMRTLVASLAVTPLRWVTRWNKLILVRRMLGLAALYYTLMHIALWCVDLKFAWMQIIVEMFVRLFLTVGLAATVLMIVLGVTSNDYSIKQLGAQRWNQLHAWTYFAAVLSLVHYFMEIRLDATEAALMTGLFVLLMAFRLLRKRLTLTLVWLSLTAVLCAVATAAIEAIYYAFSTQVSIQRVLSANFDFSYTIRPAWWVLAAGLVIAVLAEWRNRVAPAPSVKRSMAAQQS